MLSWMQKHKKYLVITIWISVIAFVGAGFVGWGSYDFNANRSNSIASVGHRNISIQEFQNRYSQIHSYYAQLFDGKLSEEKANELGLQEQTVQNLIQESLLLNFADDIGLGVNNDDIINYIVADQSFQTDGKFDKKKYEEILKRMGVSANEFENSLKSIILLNKLRYALQIPASQNDIELMAASFLMQDKVSIQVIKNEQNIKIDENELKTLWESRKSEFKTRTKFELETEIISPLNIEVNESVLNNFYDENKENYKDFNDKILPFENAKDDVKKDYILKQTKTYADKEYLKIKKGEKQAPNKLTTDEDNLTIPAEELKIAKIGYTAKPFEFEKGYMIAKISNIEPQRVMSFDEARIQVLEIYKEQKTKELVEQKAKDLLEKGFDGINIGFVSRDEIKPIAGLSPTEFGVFVSKLFESKKKKSYVLLDNKAVVYEILEQKLLDSKKETEYKDVITQNVSYLKNNELIQDLINALQKRYEIKYYYKR
jgi:wbnF